MTRSRSHRRLRRADGPITIIAGEQVARDDARAELEQLRALLRARVATVPDAKDVAGTPGLGSSSALGVTGVMGHPGVAAAVAESALCLLVGTRMSVTARAGLDDALASVPTYSIGSAAPYRAVYPRPHRRSARLADAADAALRGMAGRPASGAGSWWRAPSCSRRRTTGLGCVTATRWPVLDAALPDGVDIVVDAGNIGASAIHYLPVRRDGRFLVALGMGGMGYSFGAGIGVAFVGRQPRTVVIAGDGAFFMHGMEIHTALQYRLPVTFLLFDNHAHAMCVTREQLFYDDLLQLQPVRPQPVGRGPGRPCSPVWRRSTSPTIDELPAALQAALDVDGPSVVSVECSADEIPPFAAFLARPAGGRALLNRTRRTVPMSLPALEDITAHHGTTDPIDGVIRIETSPREKATPIIMEMMRSVYPHDEVFGEYCTVNDYIDCPPDELFDYLADTRCLEEWTYSLRGFTPTEEPGLWWPTTPAPERRQAVRGHGNAEDGGSPIYTRTVANEEARTVDYHCAWDQGKHLWMIYLMRVVDAQVVFDKPGSVVLWTNCHHPFYDKNPYPETAPPERPVWVGDFWDMFGAGHLLELKNLKAIAEYRHHNGLPVTPDWMR